MYLKDTDGFNIDMVEKCLDKASQKIEDQSFIDELKGALLNTLSDESIGIIKKYEGRYFTGDEDIDRQILDTIISIGPSFLTTDFRDGKVPLKINENQGIENNDKMQNLLFILKNTIRKDFFSKRLCLSNKSKNHIKSVLSTAIDKYSIQDLEMLYSFDNITFDILENLNGFDNEQWIQVLEIMNLLKSRLGTKIFPISISTENIKNIKNNILILKDSQYDNVELLKEDGLNTCFLINGKTSIVDLLSLPYDDFKLVMPSIGNDHNMLSICFLGYENYKFFCNELRKHNFTDDKMLNILSKIKYYKGVKWMSFWIDKGLPIDKILSCDTNFINIDYENCSYIYDNVTKDPDQLINLFKYEYETFLYMYNNITKDINQIVDLFDTTNGIKLEYIKDIYESIKKCDIENAYENFKEIIKTFLEKESYGNVAFFCKHFTKDFLNLSKEGGFYDFNLRSLLLKSRLENLEFFYDKKIFTSLDDFLRDKDTVHVLYVKVEWLQYLYDKGLCTTKNDFISLVYYIAHTGGTLLRGGFENVKYLYTNGIFTTFDDLLSKDNVRFFAVDLEHIKFFYENNICKTINDFISIGNSMGGVFEIKNFLFEKGICTRFGDFIELGKTKLLSANFKNVKFVYEKGICTTLNDFIKHEKIIVCADNESLSALNELYINKDESYDEWINLFGTISNSSYSGEYKNEIIHKISLFSIDKAKIYVKICEIFDNSNSYDIQVVKDLLIVDIINTSDPEDVVKKVKTIFMESDLPMVSKIFQVFKYIYTENNFKNYLKEDSSPYLQSLSLYSKRLETIYKDLMNVMIKSGESSLKDFILSIISSKETLGDFEKGKSLDNEGRIQVLSLMKKIISLNAIINNHGGKNMEIIEHNGNIDDETLKKYYTILKRSLLLKKDDSIYIFFLSLCKKLGYDSLENIMNDMEKSQMKAHDNGLGNYHLMKNGQIFNLSSNYFLKGIKIDSLGEILNRGVTSTEYLGGGEGTSDKVSSNGTPFDTDGVVVNGKDILEVATLHGYGDLAIIINIDKPRIYNSDAGLDGYDSKMYEIFKNHRAYNNDYYGIRTGIASTEFEAIIYKSKDINLQNLQQIKYLVAKKGFYLPILDLKGNILFTPQEYHTLRQSFSFSDKYKGYDVEQKQGIYVSSNQNDTINMGSESFDSFINGALGNIDISHEILAKSILDKIKDVLESELGIKCNQNKNLLGAELYDSGSTGRGTEIPSNDIDVDFTLLLNSEDYGKLETIQKAIHEKIGTTESGDHCTDDGTGLQIKSKVNSLGKEYGYKDGIRFDLLIIKKTKSYLYPSNIAMQDRLQKVEELYGESTLKFVRQNIAIMKKLLKTQGIYKNTEGGLGGIGVENRIMQHHGNLVEALESFEQIAYGGKYEYDKANIPFDEFKNFYNVRDSGHNFRGGKNDNYILKMNESGYKGILNIIKKYRTEGLIGLAELINNHNRNLRASA